MKSLRAFAPFLLLIIFTTDWVFSQEIHTESNAASIANESNSINGWAPANSGTALSVESNDVYQGSYAIRIQAQADAASRGAYSFSTTANTQYKIVVYAKKLSPNAGFWAWEGFTDFAGVDMVGTDWNRYEFNFTASGTEALIKVYAGAPATIGDAVLIDYISIQELDSSPPVAPVLSETSHTDDLINLSWTGASDNIGVVGYNIYKNNVLLETLSNITIYQASGLSPITSYQFYVTALDYYGNESIASNVITVTTDTVTSGNNIWLESGSIASYSGEVGVGTTTVPSGYKMAVDGKFITEEVRVELSGTWPDYVFMQGYGLPTLEEVKKHIEDKGHLPNIPSAGEITANGGVELGEMNRLLLEKIEELTLYVIQLQERLLEQENKNEHLEVKLVRLQESMEQLKN